MSQITLPLSNVQQELLKLYSKGVSDEELEELKLILAKFYAEKSIKLANEVWDEKGYTDKDMDRILNGEL